MPDEPNALPQWALDEAKPPEEKPSPALPTWAVDEIHPEAKALRGKAHDEITNHFADLAGNHEFLTRPSVPGHSNPLVWQSPNGGSYVTGGDEGAGHFADRHAYDYGQYLQQIGVDPKTIESESKVMREHAFQSARQWQMQQAENQAHEQGAGAWGSSEWAQSLIPGWRQGYSWANDRDIVQAKDRFKNNEATMQDYALLGKQGAVQRSQSEMPAWQKVSTGTLGMGAAVSEFGMTAGAGKFGAEAAGWKEAANLPMTLKQTLAFSTGITAANLGKYFAGVQQRAAQGESLPKAYTKTAISDWMDNTIFAAIGPLEGKAGGYVSKALKGTLTNLVAGEASEDLKRIARLSPEGGPVWRAILADSSEERAKAVSDMWQQGLPIALMSAMHAALPHAGPETDHEKLAESTVEQVFEEEAKNEKPGNAPGEAPQGGTPPVTPPNRPGDNQQVPPENGRPPETGQAPPEQGPAPAQGGEAGPGGVPGAEGDKGGANGGTTPEPGPEAPGRATDATATAVPPGGAAVLKETDALLAGEGTPAFISANLKRLAEAWKVTIEPTDTPNQVIDKIRGARSRYAPDLDAAFAEKSEPAQEAPKPQDSRYNPDLDKELLGYGASGAQKIQTDMPKPTGAQGELGTHDIREFFSKAFDVPTMLSGRVKGKTAMAYDPRAQAVLQNSKHFGDLGALSHEIAHHIDTSEGVMKSLANDPAILTEIGHLDYDPQKQRPFEGFAERLRSLMTGDPPSAPTPKFDAWFSNWMKSHPDIAGKLGQGKGLIDAWRQQGALGRVMGNIYGMGEEPKDPNQTAWGAFKEKAGNAWRGFRKTQMDDLAVTAQFSRAVEEAHAATGAKGKFFAEGTSPEDLARAFRFNGPNYAKDTIENGYRSLKTGQTFGPGLKEVLQDIAPQDYKRFRAWVYARSAIEAWGKGINPGISEADAKYVLANHGEKGWGDLADKFTDHLNGGLALLAENGVITPKAALDMMKDWNTYIPFMRVRPDQVNKGKGGAGMVDLGDTIKKRTGGDFAIRDPFEYAQQRAAMWYDRATKQIVTNAIIEAAKQVPGLGKWAIQEPPQMEHTGIKTERIWDEVKPVLLKAGLSQQEIDAIKKSTNPDDMINLFNPRYWFRGDQPVVRILNDQAKPEMWRVNPELYSFMKGMDRTTLPWYLNSTVGALARFERSGATALKSTFAPKHLANYLMTAMMQTRQNVAKDFIPNALQGMQVWLTGEAVKATGGDPGEAFKLWERSGVMLGNIIGMDYNSVRAQTREMMKNTTVDKLKNLLVPQGWENVEGVNRGIQAATGAAKLPAQAYMKIVQGMTHASDIAPRLSEFFGSLKQDGLTIDDINKGKMPTQEQFAKAINRAREVSIDFTRAGTVGRVLNQFLPFWNARLQGMDKAVRSFRDDPKTMLMRSGVLIATAAANWWFQKDQDWRKAAEPFVKYGMFTFTNDAGKPVLRLPHTHEYGWSIYAGTQAVLDGINEKNPGVLADWWHNASHRIGFPFAPLSIIPSYAAAPLENISNYDFFRGRPVVPQHMAESLQPADQTTGHATFLAKQLGQHFNWSPDKIDHLLEGESGGLYRSVLGSAEAVGNISQGKAPNMADVPVIGGAAFRRDYVRDEQDFYNRQEELKQSLGSQKLGEPGAAKPAELHRMEEYAKIAHGIRDAMKRAGPTDRDAQFEYEKYLYGTFRAGLGREELARYPNPLKADNLPPDIQQIVDNAVGAMHKQMQSPVPTRGSMTQLEYSKHRKDWEARRQNARDIISESGNPEVKGRVMRRNRGVLQPTP